MITDQTTLVILQYVGAAVSVSSVAIINLLPRYIIMGFMINAVGVSITGLYALSTEQYAIMAAQIAYVLLNLFGIYQWTKFRRNTDR